MVSESRVAAAVAPTESGWLDRRFRLSERRTNPRTEIIAGATTFLAAAYLLVVIPSILASGGLDRGAATTTTIMVFVAATLFMAFYANLPFIVGPGIGGSVIVATTLVLSEGVKWQIGIAIALDRKSTRLNSSHTAISYAVFCLKKKKRRRMRI